MGRTKPAPPARRERASGDQPRRGRGGPVESDVGAAPAGGRQEEGSRTHEGGTPAGRRRRRAAPTAAQAENSVGGSEVTAGADLADAHIARLRQGGVEQESGGPRGGPWG